MTEQKKKKSFLSKKLELPKIEMPTFQRSVSASTQPVKSVQRPVFSKCIAIITKNVNGQRIALKTIKVSALKEFFRLGTSTFHIDVSKAFMLSGKGFYLMYDIDITEPLDKTAGSIEHIPIELGDTVHYSKSIDLLVQGEVIKQALKSIRDDAQFNFMWIIMLIIGAVMGYALGVAFPAGGKTVVTTTITKTTTSTLMYLLTYLKEMFL